jgi:hypothetical protein
MFPELLICSGIVIMFVKDCSVCESESQWDVTKYDVHCCNNFPFNISRGSVLVVGEVEHTENKIYSLL